MGEASRRAGRRKAGAAHAIENGGGRVAGLDRDGDDAAAGGFDFFAADDFVRAPVATFNENAREKASDEVAGRGGVEDGDVVHGGEGGEDFSALVLGHDGATGAFEGADACVAIDGDDEKVAERAGLLETTDVAGMEKVKTAVGEDDATGVAFGVGNGENQVVLREDLTHVVNPGGTASRQPRPEKRASGGRELQKMSNCFGGPFYHAGQECR